MKNTFSLFLALIMISTVFSIFALSAPPEPNFHQFYGTVTGADEDLSVKAQVGSKSFEAAIVDGEYGKDTPFLVEGKEGDMIKFFINDAQVEAYTLAIGEATELNLELKGTGSIETGTNETVSTEEATTGAEEAVPAEEATAAEESAGGEAALPEGEPGAGEAAAETLTGAEGVAAGEKATAEAKTEGAGVSQLEEQKKAGGNSNFFTWLIVIGAAFLLGVTVLLLVFWKKGQPKQIGDSNELFYGETCKHPSHQQYPVHKHERQEGTCQAPEHKNYPLHRH